MIPDMISIEKKEVAPICTQVQCYMCAQTNTTQYRATVGNTFK